MKQQNCFEFVGRLALYLAGYCAVSYVLEIPDQVPSFKWVMFLLLYIPLALPMLFPDLFNRE